MTSPEKRRRIGRISVALFAAGTGLLAVTFADTDDASRVAAASGKGKGAGAGLVISVEEPVPAVPYVEEPLRVQLSVMVNDEAFRREEAMGGTITYKWTVVSVLTSTPNPTPAAPDPEAGRVRIFPDFEPDPAMLAEFADHGWKQVRVRVVVTLTRGGVEVATKSGEADITFPVVRMRLRSVTFESPGLADGNVRTFHVVAQDDGTEYPVRALHWLDRNFDGKADQPATKGQSNPEHRFPLCQTRNTKVAVAEARFRLEPRLKADLKMKVAAKSPTVDTFAPDAKTGKQEFSLRGGLQGIGSAVNFVSKNALPNTVAKLDPLAIEWTFELAGDSKTRPAGTSDNRCYVTHAAPIIERDVPRGRKKYPLYESVLDISCRGANGKRIKEQLPDAIYGVFVDELAGGVRRKKLDGYNNEDPRGLGKPAGMTYWARGKQAGTCQTIEEMLRASDGDGSCIAWSQLMHRTLLVQGFDDAQIWDLTPDKRGENQDATEFLVKNWSFAPRGTEGLPFAWSIRRGEARDDKGLPGQGFANPLGSFERHWILKVGDTIYDPSYGSGPFGPAPGTTGRAAQRSAELAHEKASIDGLRRRGDRAKPASVDPRVKELNYGRNRETE